MTDHCNEPQRECPFNQIEWGRMMQKLEDIHDLVRLQNGRVRSLEAWRWKMAGGIAVGIAVLKIAGIL